MRKVHEKFVEIEGKEPYVLNAIKRIWSVLVGVLLFGFSSALPVFAGNPQMGDHSDRIMLLMFILLGVSLVLIILFIVLSLTRRKKK